MVHKRVHNGHRPYKCDLCDMLFTSGGNLKSHRSLHTGAKVGMCPFFSSFICTVGGLYLGRYPTVPVPYRYLFCRFLGACIYGTYRFVFNYFIFFLIRILEPDSDPGANFFSLKTGTVRYRTVPDLIWHSCEWAEFKSSFIVLQGKGFHPRKVNQSLNYSIIC